MEGTSSARALGVDIREELGRGARGVVYRVRRDGRDWAMKVLHSWQTDERTRAAFLREAALLACVRDPGLAEVHEVGELDGRPYLIMDLVRGGELAEALRAGPLPPERVISVGLEVAGALASAHRLGVVHRDIKPENILIDQDGGSRLIDFGLAGWEPARLATDSGQASQTSQTFPPPSSERTDTVVGTLAYSSPEQIGVLNRPVDARSDLYSLGVVLFECATGTQPFASDDVSELVRMHAATTPADIRDLRPGLPDRLAAIVARLLRKDPDDRYQNSAELLGELRLAAADLGEIRPAPTDDAEREIPFVGRAGERAALRAAWDRARAGRGSVVLVTGPPGSGRSRLLTHLAATIREEGHPAPLVACDEDRSPLARWDAAVLAAAPAAAPAGDGTGPGLRTGSDRAAPALATVVAQLRELALSWGGAVLCVDDAQWIDGATRRALDLLATGLDRLPLLVVLTAPDDDHAAPRPGTPWQALVDELVDQTIPISPLRVDEVSQLVSATCGGRVLSAELAERLATRGGITPLGALEYLRAVLDAGLLRPRWGELECDLEALGRIDLPTDVLGLLRRHLGGLPRLARDLLAAGAVVGHTFSPTLAARALGIPEELATAALGEAVAAGLVEQRAGDLAFVHDRIRRDLLESFDPATARDLNQRIAELLDTTPGGSVYALARHYLRGEAEAHPTRVFQACVAAGRAALDDHSSAEAVWYLERALDTGHTLSPDEGDVRELLAEAYERAGRLGEAVEALGTVLDSCPTPIDQARVCHTMAVVRAGHWETDQALTDARAGLDCLGRALPRTRGRLALGSLGLFCAGLVLGGLPASLGRARDGRRREALALEARLCLTAARAASRSADPWLTALLSLRARYAAARLGPSAELSAALTDVAVVARLVGLPWAGRGFRRAIAMAHQIGDDRAVAYADHARVASEAMAGARTERETLQRLAEHRLNLPIADYIDTACSLALGFLLRGHTRDARAAYEAGRARLAEADASDHTIVFIGAGVAALSGELAVAEAQLSRATSAPDAFGNPGERVNHLIAIAQVAVEQRDFGPAFVEAAATFASLAISHRRLLIPQRVLYVYLGYGFAERCRAGTGEDRRRDRAELARAVATLASAYARGVEQVRAHLLVLRATLRDLDGDHEGALNALGGADRLLRRVDVPLARFEAARLRARALAALGLDAGGAAASAHAEALRHGWPHRAEWIRAEFGPTGGMAAPTSDLDESRRPGHGVPPADPGGVRAFHADRTRLHALEQMSVVASRIVDPTELTRVALDEIIKILSAERAYLFLTEAGSQRLVPRLGRDSDGHDIQRLTGYGSTLVERVRVSREPLVVTGSEEGAALGSRSVVAHGLRSIMVAPLLFDARLLGVIYLDSRVAKGMFTGSDAGILAAIASFVAAALETARAAQLAAEVRAAQRERNTAENLREAMALVSSTLDPTDVLRRLRQAMTSVIPAESWWLATLGEPSAPHGVARMARTMVTISDGTDETGDADEIGETGETGETSARAAAGAPGARRRLPQTVDLSSRLDLADLVARRTPVTGGSGEADDLGDRGGWGDRAPGDAPLDTGAWLAIPLVSRDTPVGLLILGRNGGEPYDGTHAEIASAIAEQGMVAYDNARLFTQVRHLAATDGLTGLLNRRGFAALAKRTLGGATRAAEPGAGAPRPVALMVDIDHFKGINDRYGHHVGDQVIQAVAGRLSAGRRHTDLVCRYGGEEFALLLPDTADAEGLAERLRTAVATQPVQTDAGPVAVTISVGMAYATDTDQTTLGLLDRADAALYGAKAAGRDRVVVAGPA